MKLKTVGSVGQRGSKVIKVLEKDRVKALQKIIQLNPFDAVVMIRKIQTRYVIEGVNEKVIQLF